MASDTIEQIKAEADQGLAALEKQLADQASVHFNNALNLAEDIEDDRARRDQFALLSGLFEQCGYPDLALAAAGEAVELDRALQLDELLPQDVISIGNAHQLLGNTQKARASFTEALTMLVSREDWANAASANTNLAGLLANDGDLPAAIDLLETSLQYLAKDPFPDTEIQTRFGLLQAYEIQGRDVSHAVDNARQLTRFLDEMPSQQRAMTAALIERVAERYLNAHPQPHAAAWKAETFPQLYP